MSQILRRVIKRVSLVDQVYEKIRDRIVSLKIPFGSKLNVSKLQEEYGVSSTPVREALNRLLNDGLIELENNVGARVIDITEEDVRQIQELSFAYQIVCGRMIYDIRMELFKYLKNLSAVPDRTDDRFQMHIRIIFPKFHLDVIRIIFIYVKNNQCFRLMCGDLSAKF